MPERKRERRRRVARLEDTHPPTALLEQPDRRSPQVTLDAWTSGRIDAELEPLAAIAGDELVDGYRSRLHT